MDHAIYTKEYNPEYVAAAIQALFQVKIVLPLTGTGANIFPKTL